MCDCATCATDLQDLISFEADKICSLHNADKYLMTI